MPSLIHDLSQQWDLWIGPFRAFFPTGDTDRETCQTLLTDAGIAEPGSKPGQPQMESLLAACLDTRSGELVSALYVTDAAQVSRTLAGREQYHLELFNSEQLAKTAVFSQLAIQPAYYKTEAPSVLLSHCFIEVLKAGGLAALMSCDVGHFSLYKRMGMRPIGPLSKTPAGDFSLPMICIPDYDYLSIIQSPLLPLMRGVDFNPYDPICKWYYQLVRENSALQVGSTILPPSEEDFEGHHSITQGLSKKGLEAFLKNAMVRNCREGELLIKENDGGKAFGFVRRGLVKVLIGDKTIVLLGEGDIFGELAFILQSKRTAQVVAASPDTEVVLFSESAIDRLETEADRTAIWRNLARVLAQKVMVTNKLLDGSGG